jgi:hypothetical protein
MKMRQRRTSNEKTPASFVVKRCDLGHKPIHPKLKGSLQIPALLAPSTSDKDLRSYLVVISYIWAASKVGLKGNRCVQLVELQLIKTHQAGFLQSMAWLFHLQALLLMFLVHKTDLGLRQSQLVPRCACSTLGL